VQAAIDASAQPATIYVCPGSYAEGATGLGAVRILNPLTLIGAGDGDDPTTSTILTPVSSNEPVVYVETASPVLACCLVLGEETEQATDDRECCQHGEELATGVEARKRRHERIEVPGVHVPSFHGRVAIVPAE
jgi:hypothetical protein